MLCVQPHIRVHFPAVTLPASRLLNFPVEHEHVNRVAVANSVLAALPRREYQRLLTSLEPVPLAFSEVLYEPGKPIRHVYFPSDSLVSLLTLVEGHMALEIGLVGREGMLGIPVALGINDSPVRALVQGSGTALRMTSAHFRSEYGKCEHLHGEVGRYIHERILQITQTAACNRFHPIEARLARWLLMTRDRMGTNHFHHTHELLGNMLGVLRVAVTNAAGALQQRKLISYSRGEINILDGQGLEAAACRCYQIIKDIPNGARA
jgi:CRP-like cAMP-binding protein